MNIMAVPPLPEMSESFSLDNDNGSDALETEPFHLDAPMSDGAPEQAELFLPQAKIPSNDHHRQIEFEGMQPQCFTIDIVDRKTLLFQQANSLLESLEDEDVDVHYQCREGYCGSCRVHLLAGEVHYLFEPMAWLNADEILTCCCVPKTHLKIKLL